MAIGNGANVNGFELAGGLARGTGDLELAAVLFNDSHPVGTAMSGAHVGSPPVFDATMKHFPGASTLLPADNTGLCSFTPEDDAAIAAAFERVANSATLSRTGDRVTARLPAAEWIATPGQGGWVQGVHLARDISCTVSDGGPNGTLSATGLSGITIGGRNDWTHWGVSSFSLTGDTLTVRAGFGAHFDNVVNLGQGGGAAFRAEFLRRVPPRP